MNTKNPNTGYTVTFGEIIHDISKNKLEMPPKNAHEKYIQYLDENFVDLVVHKNTREILNKLARSKEIKNGIDK